MLIRTKWRFWTSWRHFWCTLWRSQLLCLWRNFIFFFKWQDWEQLNYLYILDMFIFVLMFAIFFSVSSDQKEQQLFLAIILKSAYVYRTIEILCKANDVWCNYDWKVNLLAIHAQQWFLFVKRHYIVCFTINILSFSWLDFSTSHMSFLPVYWATVFAWWTHSECLRGRGITSIFLIIQICECEAIHIYRPHPKDDGRLYFQSVHTCGGGGVLHLRSG